jgi:GT2 family glycosyltransferase
MTLDVVIPTRDRPDRLAATLHALARQDCADFGVVVVDDGGRLRARDVETEGLSVQFLRNDVSIGPGPSRNRGAKASNARDIVFLDDDCVADAELIGRHRAALAGTDPVVSLGPILAAQGQRLSVWTHWDSDRLERHYRRIANGETVADWTLFYTGNAGVRRSDFLAVGGFDARLARQEDVELGYRLARFGCRVSFDPRASVVHDSDRSLQSWLRIPAASARFDVLMDRLDPDSGCLANVTAALATRHWALRLARRVVRTATARRCAVTGAVGAGRGLHALHVDRAALAAFSLVWDLTYWAALREATEEGQPIGVAT